MAVWPVPLSPAGTAPVISSKYGTRDTAYHYGSDIMWKRPTKGETALPEYSPGYWLADGTVALAFADGVVTTADATGKPYRVRIDHGNGLESQYIHLFSLKVKKGDRVREGQPVGVIGHNPDGYRLNHLHFEVIYKGNKIDPASVLAQATAVAAPTNGWLKAAGVLLPAAAIGLGGWWWRSQRRRPLRGLGEPVIKLTALERDTVELFTDLVREYGQMLIDVGDDGWLASEAPQLTPHGLDLGPGGFPNKAALEDLDERMREADLSPSERRAAGRVLKKIRGARKVFRPRPSVRERRFAERCANLEWHEAESAGQVDIWLEDDHADAATMRLMLPYRGNKLVVTDIEVKPKYRNCGLATRMYERAAAIACGRGLRLASDTTRTTMSETFWKKQVRKGRATCAMPGPAWHITGYGRGAQRVGEWPCGTYAMKRPCLTSGLDDAA
jgi:GNAT superfamily N-acetyltransferase